MKKKRNYLKLKIFTILFIISFVVSIKILNKNNKTFNNEEYLRYILSSSNPYIEVKNKDLSYYLVKGIIDFDLKSNPLFSDSKDYTNASDNDEESIVNSDYIEDPYPEKETTEPLVYIYNTHQLEEYSSLNTEEFNVTPNVMMASYILRERLYNLGIDAIVEDNNVSEIRNMNGWNYAASYKVTKMLMESAYEKYPTLNYFVDIHRDSVSKKISTVTIGDKQYAKILFIVGLDNKDYKYNLEITEKLNEMFKSKYPGISRGIYKKQGKGVNGIYNQDFHKNTILIEVGGEENTIDEVLNTTIAISEVLSLYIKENGDIIER